MICFFHKNQASETISDMIHPGFIVGLQLPPCFIYFEGCFVIQ